MQAYGKYLSGNIGKDEFLRMYCHMSPDFLKIYLEEFEYFIY